MFKLGVVSCICIITFAIYAHTVTISSTAGYFLNEAQKELTSVEFDLSISKLSVLEEERKLFETVQNNQNLRYDREDTVTTVKTYHEREQVAVK